MNAPAVVLATAIVLIVLVVVFLSRGRENFLAGDPATPKLRETTGTLSATLDRISREAAFLDAASRQIDAEFGVVDMGPAFNESRLELEAVAASTQPAVASITNFAGIMRTAPQTYANSLGVYRGLRAGDNGLLAVAASLAGVSNDIMLRLQATEGHDQSDQYGNSKLRALLQAASIHMKQLAIEIRGLVRDTHRLGSSLLLE